jgi:C4-dicarboxylate-binding protein DctP
LDKKEKGMKIGRALNFWGFISLCVLGLGLAGILSRAESAPPSTKAEFTLRCAGTMPLDHFMTKALDHYSQMVNEKTNGRMKIEVYPSNQLFSDKDLPKALPSGAVDMG